MNGGAYYNENDPFAVDWLRELITDGLIAAGEIDTRSICDVAPADLRGFTQVHLFAGLGGWSYALRCAGWPDDRPVWTGSCPCQPFSAAGKQKGTADERHLWPEMFRLASECRPDIVFGEQVEAAVRLGWLDGVFADLEAEDYACGAVVLGAHSVGAPHIRQRIYWLADANGQRQERQHPLLREGAEPGRLAGDPSETSGRSANDRRVADAHQGQRGRLTDGEGRQLDRQASGRQQGNGIAEPSGVIDGRMGYTTSDAERKLWITSQDAQPQEPAGRSDLLSHRGMGNTDDEGSQGRRIDTGEHTHQRSAWASSVLIPCADGKFRRVPANEAGEPEPSLFPLAHGVPNRVGTLRGAGNAICVETAAEFVKAWLGTSPA